MASLRLYEDDPEDGIRPEDPTYEYDSDAEEEPLEYSSEEDVEDTSARDQKYGNETHGGDKPLSYESDAKEEHKTDEESETDSASSKHESEWTFTVHGRSPPKFDTDFLPLSVAYKLGSDEDGEIDYNRISTRLEYEHIAGPNCRQLDGYNGHNVSVEQMLDCNTVQCLYIKPDDWQPNKDDMPFETDSKYYLSGLSDYSSGGGNKHFAPARHGCVMGTMDNDNNPWINVSFYFEKRQP